LWNYVTNCIYSVSFVHPESCAILQSLNPAGTRKFGMPGFQWMPACCPVDAKIWIVHGIDWTPKNCYLGENDVEHMKVKYMETNDW